jgi:S-adenosylmethionine:tRNA-ribosyltransferase-isomerase (queuine synthetase)
MSSSLKDYDYDLPKELIAQLPPKQRDASRMMVLNRGKQTIEHRQFRELRTFLAPDDLLVLNDTRVLPARRFSDDGAIEFLFLEKLGAARWKCLVKPGRKMRVGKTAKIGGTTLRVEEITPEGERIGKAVAADLGVDAFPLATLESESRTYHAGDDYLITMGGALNALEEGLGCR